MDQFKPNFAEAFSLIELMVVLAISAILVAVAIPNYRSYVTRANVADMIATVDFCKNAVYKYFIQNGRVPDGVSTDQKVICQGIEMQGTRVAIPNSESAIRAAYNVNAGAANTAVNVATFTVTHDAVIDNGRVCELYLSLTPETNGELTYSCSTNCTNRDIFPANCTVAAG